MVKVVKEKGSGEASHSKTSDRSLARALIPIMKLNNTKVIVDMVKVTSTQAKEGAMMTPTTIMGKMIGTIPPGVTSKITMETRESIIQPKGTTRLNSIMATTKKTSTPLKK